ncbi:hypothetical protein RRG08_058843 [Elysia crispata]|uniref:Uncharacterized protein n=1 Tax=Elysia crispata TaxID=231223 RepID=A0AAE1CQG7_9GAST|nr:hypothetical protein RRG08_058843 [Elysia crispata]
MNLDKLQPRPHNNQSGVKTSCFSRFSLVVDTSTIRPDASGVTQKIAQPTDSHNAAATVMTNISAHDKTHVGCLRSLDQVRPAPTAWRLETPSAEQLERQFVTVWINKSVYTSSLLNTILDPFQHQMKLESNELILFNGNLGIKKNVLPSIG